MKRYKRFKRFVRRTGTLVMTVCLLLSPLGMAAGGDPAEPCPNHAQHDADCGYTEAQAGSPCTHAHDADCGYAEGVEAAVCVHQHDEACGYVAAIEGKPCAHSCEACAPAAQEPGEQPAVPGDAVKTITAFDPLSEEAAIVVATVGTPFADLPLPKTLTATVDAAPAEVPVKEWRARQDTPAYDPNTAGEYRLVPVFDAGYAVAEGTVLPEIAVTLAPPAVVKTITAFDPLPEEAAIVAAAVGTPLADLPLLKTLTATVDGSPAEVPVKEWRAKPDTPAYDPNTAGGCVLVPVFDADYAVAEGTALPEIAVTLTPPIVVKTITAFDPLPEEAAIVAASVGTPLADLPLPKTLMATVDGSPAEVPVKEWQAKQDTPAYDPIMAGEYRLVPAFDADYAVAEGAALPEIAVMLGDPGLAMAFLQAAQIAKEYRPLVIDESAYTPRITIIQVLACQTWDGHTEICDWGNGTTVKINDSSIPPDQFSTDMQYAELHYRILIAGEPALWCIYIPGKGYIKSTGSGQSNPIEFVEIAEAATGWQIIPGDSYGYRIVDPANKNNQLQDYVWPSTPTHGVYLYQKVKGSNGYLESFTYTYEAGGTPVTASSNYYGGSQGYVYLPCNTNLSKTPSITGAVTVDPEASYAITSAPSSFAAIDSTDLLWIQGYRYKSSASITVTSEAGGQHQWPINFYITPHDLAYSASGNIVYERCSICGHQETATLIAGDIYYNEPLQMTARVEYSSGWFGAKHQNISYTNNSVPGPATATFRWDTATAAVKQFTILRGRQSAPNVLGVNETISGKNDGQITGVDSTMEYRLSTVSSYTPVTGTTGKIQNLPPGTYYVRYPVRGYYDPSPDATVTIAPGRKLTVIFEVNKIAYSTVEVAWQGGVESKNYPDVPPKTGYDRTRPYWDKTLAELQNLETDVIVKPIYTLNQYRVILHLGFGYTLSAVSPSASPVDHGGSYTFALSLNQEYVKTSSFAVKVNGTPVALTAQDTYTITDISDDISVTVEGLADTVPPTATVQYKANSFKSFLNSITFGLFFKKTLNATIQAADQGAGMETVEYYKAPAAVSDPQSISGWTLLGTAGGSFSVAQNEKFVLYVRLTDKAGNVAIVHEGLVVYADSAADTANIQYILTSNQDQQAAVMLNGNTIAGITNGTATLVSGTDYSIAGNVITFRAGYLENLAAGSYVLTVSYNPMDELFVAGGDNETPAETQINLTVSKAVRALSLTGLGSAYRYGDAPFNVGLSGTLGGGTPIYAIQNGAGVAGISGNTVSILKAGSFEITASLAENDKYAASFLTSGPIPVYEATPVVALTSADVNYRQQVTLNATAAKPSGSTGAIPGGTVTFKEGTRVLAANVPLVNGAASYTTTTAPGRGGHTYTVEYSGETGYYAAGSASTGVTVRGIYSVSILPQLAVVTKGSTQQFAATVDEVGNANKNVRWRVSGGDGTTAISADGLLTVSPTETARTLIVTATSIFDATYEDTATVSVKEVPFGFVGGSVHKIGSGTSLRFGAEKDYGMFSRVLVDGRALGSGQYKAESGSTSITLPAAYLDTLPVGNHTLSVEFSDGWKAGEPFTVTAANTVSVSGVALNKASATIKEGTALQLAATVMPDNAPNNGVSWSSSNSSIATADQNGKVTAHKAGVATITVTTDDGGHMATCRVTVVSASAWVPVTGVTLDKTSATVTAGDTLQLTASVQPGNASNKGVSWSSSDVSIATVDQNGLVTAHKPGEAAITATTDDGGHTATCDVTVVAAAAGELDAERIAPESVPLAAPAQPEKACAVLNLMLAVLSLGLGVYLAAAIFRRGKVDIQAIRTVRGRPSGIAWRLLGILAGIGSVIAFLLTERISAPAVFADKWTPLMIAICAVQVGATLLMWYVRKDTSGAAA